MLEVGLSSTVQIAGFFGIAQAGAARAPAPSRAAAETPRARPAEPRVLRPEPRANAPAHGPQAVIEKALRAAGLMR
jgi:hypothetical protein